LSNPLDNLPVEVVEGFGPGSFGFHELLDRTYLVADLFSEKVAGHPAAEHPELAERVKKIEEDLFDLYQRIGGLHCAD